MYLMLRRRILWAYPPLGHDDAVGIVPAGPDGPIHFAFESLVFHGLHHIIQGVHLIAPGGVLGQVGHEDEDHFLVELPQAFGGGQAVHARHLDVHEDQVVAGLVGIQEVGRPAEMLKAEVHSALGPVPLQAGIQATRVVWLVLHYRHCQHSGSLPVGLDRLRSSACLMKQP